MCMGTVRSFEELEIWKLAREQAREIYHLTQLGNLAKDFDLKNQMNASARSTMDCIAEGFERNSNKEFSQFLIMSKGSNGELRSQLYCAHDRKFISKEILTERINFSEVLGRKENALITYLKNSNYKDKPRKP